MTTFISGVCGVGKTSIIPYLQKILPPTYTVVDFDSRGVPTDADRNWRMEETKYWIEEGKKYNKEGKTLVICGFTTPEDIKKIAGAEADGIQLILLDASAGVIETRLKKRYTKDGEFDESQVVIGKPVNQFIQENVQFSGEMREMFQKAKCDVVDTSELSQEKVAQEVKTII